MDKINKIEDQLDQMDEIAKLRKEIEELKESETTAYSIITELHITIASAMKKMLNDDGYPT